MITSTRLFTALALLTGLVIGSALPASADGSNSPAAPGSTSPGFSQIASCISESHDLLVSIVVDESLSLRETDPSAMRVQGITTAIDSLGQLAPSDQSLNVDVSMSTFARSYRSLVGWHKLTARSAATMRMTAERQLPSRDAGNATDYRQALLGAKRQLDSRQRSLADPDACKVLLWFTDGGLDVDQQTGAALQDLCQPGGIADAVRSDGIAVVALALFRPNAGVTQSQRNQLQAVAEGRGAGVTCGTVPVSAGSAVGVYLRADDPAALQRLFAGAGALVAGANQAATISCPSTECPAGKFPLAIDPGVAGVRVLVQASRTPHVALTSPDGTIFQLRTGQQRTIDDATVSYLSRNGLATINIGFKPVTRSQSQWLISPGTSGQLGVYWFWGARLVPVSTKLKAGATNRVDFQLEDRDGSPISPRIYQNVVPSMTAAGRRIPVRIDAHGLVTGRLRLGTDRLPPHMLVTASVTARTSPSHVRLGPVTSSPRLPVVLPPAYPQVKQPELDFGHLEGLGTAMANLSLTGSELGPTRVCFAGSTVKVPGKSPRSGLISPSIRCIRLGRGATTSVTMALRPGTSADGVANGEVRLRLMGADGSKQVTLQVPAVLDMARPVDERTRWALVGMLVAFALLLPGLMLVGSNLLLARFTRNSTSRTAVKRVRVTRSGLHPVEGAALLEPEDYQYVGFSGTRRGSRLALDGTGITLGAKRIFSFRAPVGMATSRRGTLLVSSVLPYRSQAPNEAPVTLGEVDASFVVIDAAATSVDEIEATLVSVVPVSVERDGILERGRRLASAPVWDRLVAEAAQLLEAPSVTSPHPHDQPEQPASEDSPPRPSVGTHDVPPLPAWAREEEPGPSPAHEHSKRSRLRLRRHDGTDSAGIDQTASASDDDLPPMPDFLK